MTSSITFIKTGHRAYDVFRDDTGERIGGVKHRWPRVGMSWKAEEESLGLEGRKKVYALKELPENARTASKEEAAECFALHPCRDGEEQDVLYLEAIRRFNEPWVLGGADG